jgi:hypothetical protein
MSADTKIQPIPDPATDIEMVSMVELLMLGIESKFGRAANALERIAAGTNNIEALTQQVHRLADSLDSISNTLACVTDSVEGADGVSRCYVRTRDENHGWLLSERDERESD